MSNNRIPINRINKFFSEEEIINSKFKLYGLYCPLYADLKYIKMLCIGYISLMI